MTGYGLIRNVPGKNHSQFTRIFNMVVLSANQSPGFENRCRLKQGLT